jgi:hypothetical protein
MRCESSQTFFLSKAVLELLYNKKITVRRYLFKTLELFIEFSQDNDTSDFSYKILGVYVCKR